MLVCSYKHAQLFSDQPHENVKREWLTKGAIALSIAALVGGVLACALIPSVHQWASHTFSSFRDIKLNGEQIALYMVAPSAIGLTLAIGTGLLIKLSREADLDEERLSMSETLKHSQAKPIIRATGLIVGALAATALVGWLMMHYTPLLHSTVEPYVQSHLHILQIGAYAAGGALGLGLAALAIRQCTRKNKILHNPGGDL